MNKTISKKCYQLHPQRYRNINIDNYVRNNDWLNQLILLCKPATKADFNKHLGPSSNYLSCELLFDALKFHYAVLSGALRDVSPVFKLTDNQKAGIIFKINEGIAACTPGFHGRINSLLESYFRPQSIDELLQLIRHEIVERVANEATDDVHGNNHFFIVASEMGLGVHAKLQNDPYRGILSTNQIREMLARAFAEQFQPFTTLLKLKEIIASAFDSYAGKKTDGTSYTEATYGPGLEYLKNIFNEPELNYDYLISDEQTGIISDIHWGLIFNKLWNILTKNEYFNYSTWSSRLKSMGYNWLGGIYAFVTQEMNYDLILATVGKLFLDPTINDCQDLNKIGGLFSSEVECFAYLNCNPYLLKEHKLSIIFDYMDKTYPNYLWNEFCDYSAEHPDLEHEIRTKFSEKYPTKLNELGEAMLRDENLFNNLSFDALKRLVFKLRHIPLSIRSSIFEQPNGLMKLVLASKNHPEWMLQSILLVGDLEQDKLGILLAARSNKRTLLDLSVFEGRSNPQVALALINIIARLPDNDCYLLLYDQAYDALTTALQHCPQAAVALINLILTLTPERRASILTQSYHKGTVLAKAVQYCPEAAALLINILSEIPPNLLHNIKLSESMLAGLQYRLSAVTSLLSFMLLLDRAEQKRVVDNVLIMGLFNTPAKAWFKALLKLNQRVNSLAEQPSKLAEFTAANELQKTLITSLNHYVEHSKQENSFTKLQTQWHKAIEKAHVTLKHYDNWSTFLLNLGLVLLSIPLLGLPLAVNYYRTGYKHVFFQTEEVCLLEQLDEMAQCSIGDAPVFANTKQ